MSDGSEVLAHRILGEGEPVMLLNGGMMTQASWEPISSALAERHEVVLSDFRGQLLSPGDAPREMAGHADDLERLLDRIGLDAAHLIGTSFGAEVGLLFAATRPQRVRSLVAATATDYASAAMLQGVEDLHLLVEETLAGGDPGRFQDRLIEEVYSRDYVERHREELAARRAQVALLPGAWFRGLDGILASLEGLDLRPHLQEISCPTLVVIAGDDRVMPPERSRALAAAIPGAEVAVHPTSGHALVAEDPEWFTRVCLEFLERHARPSSET